MGRAQLRPEPAANDGGSAAAVPESRIGAAAPDAMPCPAKPLEAQPQDLSRRLFLARAMAVTAGAVAVGTAGTGVVLANTAPVVRRVPIAIVGLDPALIG